MSLWAAYQKERLGWNVIEENQGFIAFSVQQPFMRIEELFVKPEARKLRIATKLANKVTAIAKAEGCTHLWAHVALSTNGASDSLKVILAYGFLAVKADQDHIYLTKEIKEEGK